MYRKTKLTIHKQIMKYQKNKTIKIINDEKKKYIEDQISSSNNSKQLHFVLNNLTCKNNKVILPSDTPLQMLPDKFNSFFIDKISIIRNALDSVNTTQPVDIVTFSGSPLQSFSSVTCDQVKNIIIKSKKSFCELDSLPGDIFMHCIDTLLPFMTSILNDSLNGGIFPVDLKIPLLLPLLKSQVLTVMF